MLEVMRKYKRSILIKGVFTLIVLSFIGTMFLIWGEGEKGFGNSDYAVKVGRTKISYEQFQETYGRLRNMYQQLSGQPLTPEMEKQLGLKKIALENIVNTTLMRQEAKKMGIKISDDEVVKAIAAIPAFQRNGAFDSVLYQQVLMANRMTADNFEANQKDELLLKKARQKIMDQVTVTDEEALQAFRKRNDQVNLAFTSFSPAEVSAEVKLSEAELNDYLQKHRDEYKTPEKISISFIRIEPAKVAAGLQVSNDEAAAFYQKNIDRYQANGSILPFDQVKDRVRDDALKLKGVKKAYEMAADAMNRSLKTSDLNQAARILGVKPEQTPLFSVQQPPSAIAGENDLIRRAFSQKTGELGGPAETGRGVYLYKVETRKPAEVPPLAQVRSEVQKSAAAEKAGEVAYRKAAEALGEMAKGKTPPNVQETGLFSYSPTGDIPKIGKSGEIMEAAFDLTRTSPDIKTPIKSGSRWYALKLKNRLEADTAEFRKNKEQIKQALLPAKREEAVVKWLDGLKKNAKVVRNPLLFAE